LKVVSAHELCPPEREVLVTTNDDIRAADQFVCVGTAICSIRKDMLLWVATTDTVNPYSVGDLVEDVADAVRRELERENGLNDAHLLVVRLLDEKGVVFERPDAQVGPRRTRTPFRVRHAGQDGHQEREDKAQPPWTGESPRQLFKKLP
jgi:hypothetical protein